MSDPLAPDFLAAPMGARWKGRLDMLFVELMKESIAAGPSPTWSWRILPRGAAVGLRKWKDGRHELRIARRGELKPENEGRWEAEVRIFLDKMGVQEGNGVDPAFMYGGYWLRRDPREEDAGSTVARFVELFQGEVRPGKGRCHDCWTDDQELELVEWHPSFGVRGHRCNRHAIEAGRREARQGMPA